MSLAKFASWLWSGDRHTHTPVGRALASLRPDGELRSRLMEVDRCGCGAVRPVEYPAHPWIRGEDA